MSIFDRFKKQNYNTNFNYVSWISKDKFLETRLKALIWNILEDAVQGYTINPFIVQSDSGAKKVNNNPFLNIAIDNKMKNISNVACSLQEVLYESLFCSFNLGLLEAGNQYYFFFANQQQVEQGFILNANRERLPIIRSVWINRPIIGKEIILKPLESLYLQYKKLDFSLQNSDKLVFKKENFNATFDLTKQDKAKMDLQEVLTSRVMLIDSKDELGLFDFGSIDQGSIDFVYSELSSILKVPQSKLRGLAPQGMNATGEYDDKAYFDTLENWRKMYIEPILDAFSVSYDNNLYTDSQLLDIIVKVSQASADIEISGLMDKAKILLERILPDVK